MAMGRLSRASSPVRKVAIVGGGPTRYDAPFKDLSWEIWGFSSKNEPIPRVTRWFEIHDLEDLKQQLATPKKKRWMFDDYMAYLRSLSCPVYMMRRQPDIPKSVVFPGLQLVKEFGRCFTCTAAYLIAFAIKLQCRELGLWGVSLQGKKYTHQRPVIAYLLGLAKQRGIRIHVPADFPLKIPDKPVFVETELLYAYDWRLYDAWWRRHLKK